MADAVEEQPRMLGIPRAELAGQGLGIRGRRDVIATAVHQQQGNIPAPSRRRICRWPPGASRSWWPPGRQAPLLGEDPGSVGAPPCLAAARPACAGSFPLGRRHGAASALAVVRRSACRPWASWPGRCRHGPSRRRCAQNGSASAADGVVNSVARAPQSVLQRGLNRGSALPGHESAGMWREGMGGAGRACPCRYDFGGRGMAAARGRQPARRSFDGRATARTGGAGKR